MRTHLKNIPARDMSQFLREQGATTKACFTHSEEEQRSYSRKLAISLSVAAEILSPRRVASSSQCIKHSFLLAPCGIDKISRNAGWGYF